MGTINSVGNSLNGSTGSGSFVGATSPTLVTPLLGTPTSGVLTNCTGLPVAGGGTGVGSTTAYAVICGGTTTTNPLQSIASVGTTGQVLTSNGAATLPTFQEQRVVQYVYTESGAVATGSTLIPSDDTIPQNTEGDQYMSLAITPKNSSNILEIIVTLQIASSVVGYMAGALFQDSTANAIAAASAVISGTNFNYSLVFTHYMAAGTTSATTFKVRAGQQNANTTTFNGYSGGRKYGGVMASSICIKEYLP